MTLNFRIKPYNTPLHNMDVTTEYSLLQSVISSKPVIVSSVFCHFIHTSFLSFHCRLLQSWNSPFTSKTRCKVSICLSFSHNEFTLTTVTVTAEGEISWSSDYVTNKNLSKWFMVHFSFTVDQKRKVSKFMTLYMVSGYTLTLRAHKHLQAFTPNSNREHSANWLQQEETIILNMTA